MSFFPEIWKHSVPEFKKATHSVIWLNDYVLFKDMAQLRCITPKNSKILRQHKVYIKIMHLYFDVKGFISTVILR